MPVRCNRTSPTCEKSRSGRGAGQCQQKKVPLARNVVEGAKCQPNGTGHCRIGVATCQPNGTGCCWYTLKARDKTEVIEPQVIRRNNRKERMKCPISKSQLSPLPQSNDVQWTVTCVGQHDVGKTCAQRDATARQYSDYVHHSAW